MAKKKSDSPAKTPKAKKPAQSSAPVVPQVDATAAAQSAARMVSAKIGPAAAQSAKPETSLFKQMKEHLAKPHIAGVDNFLNATGTANSKKSAVPFGVQKQVGHNQTFGADVNRTGVPRRTSTG